MSRPGSIIPLEFPPEFATRVGIGRYHGKDATWRISLWHDIRRPDPAISVLSSKLKGIFMQEIEQKCSTLNAQTLGGIFVLSSGQTIEYIKEKMSDTPIGATSTDSNIVSGSSPRRGLNDSGNLGSILNEAQRLTHGDRNSSYGHPYDDYTRTAALWSAILSTPITAEQAALCMCAVKLSRQVHMPKRDNMTDLAGYAWVVQEIVEEGERRNGRKVGT